MNAAVAGAIAIVVYILGYRFYSRYLSTKIFALREDFVTPAHALEDGVDYVPTRAGVLFGHHYASIAGLAPMLGPAVAVIWGWLPAMIWVVLGALFIGCVQDFGALVISVRAQGKSIGAVAEGIIGKRAKTLFHLIIFFLVALAMGVFVYVIAFLFSPAPSPKEANIHFPQAVIPSFALMGVAALLGVLTYKKGLSLFKLTPLALGLIVAIILVTKDPQWLIRIGIADVGRAPDVSQWSVILLVYAFLAAVLPVWSLLQPRDFLNCLMLYAGLGSVFVGFFVLSPSFVAPAFDPTPKGAPPMWPFVFIIIACGAASGFHSLVASGTTAKQLNKETDARVVGYGGMIGESLLGLLAVLATTAGLSDSAQWHQHYGQWSSMQGLGAQVGVFIQGCSRFLEALGVDRYTGSSLISLIVVSYALTSLDSATRLLRYNVEEIGQGLGLEWIKNRYISGGIAVAAIAFFAFYKIEGKSAGLTLWALFGTTNQLMAGLALLVITLYLLQRKKAWLVSGVPMVLMLGTTLAAMGANMLELWQNKRWLLLGVNTLLMILGVWLIAEATLAWRRYRRSSQEALPLDIEL